MSTASTSDAHLDQGSNDAPEASRRLMLQHRLLAKARLRAAAAGADDRPSEESNQNGKRPIHRTSKDGVTTSSTTNGPPKPVAGPSSSTQNNQETAALKPLPNLIGKFVDYDLTTLKNSKGGFLLETEEDDARALKQRKQVEELKRKRLEQVEKYNNHSMSINH